MKKLLLIISFLWILLLAWCWSTATQKISFDKFSMQVDPWYKSVDTSLVENKQIKDKVIKWFKITNKSWFDENIIVVKTDVKSQVSIDDFVQTNIDKLKKQTPSYSQIDNVNTSFDCSWKKIQAKYNTYKINESLDEKVSKDYYFLQYYYKIDNSWYIVSFASISKDSLDKFKTYIKSFACN